MFGIVSLGKSQRWSLRSRLTLILILALLVFQIIMMVITMALGLFPVMRQSVEDLSERLINASTYWSSLSTDKKIVYEQYIRENAGFYFFNNKNMEKSQTSGLIFNKLLSTALSKKQHRLIRIKSIEIANEEYYWMELVIQQKTIRIGFKHERIGTNPYAVFFALLALNIIFSLLTALIFVRYITQPLMNLLNAAKSLGRGIKPEIKHKNNSWEIQDLYDQFEKMSTEVQSLLENRNTLLIGISHELRTPITRLTLLLEMSRDTLGDSKLNDCNQVLQEMNAIIGQFLSLGRGIAVQESIQINLNESLQNIVDSFTSNRINFDSSYPYLITVAHDALRRVVLNLIDNALKYSEKNKVDVKVETTQTNLSIVILDRGVGIPDDKTAQILQAFVRVDKDKKFNIKGLGLGLAISHLIAQTNGWTLTFSARPEGGTIVKLNIPKTV